MRSTKRLRDGKDDAWTSRPRVRSTKRLRYGKDDAWTSMPTSVEEVHRVD